MRHNIRSYQVSDPTPLIGATKMLRSILVPLDGSPFGEHALPLAVHLARRAGSGLHLLHVLPYRSDDYLENLPFFQGPSLSASLLRKQRAYLDSVVARLGENLPVPMTAEVLEGEVAHTIRATVAGEQADLVVMTTHGRGPLQRLWLGSVADALLRDLSVPLLLIRPTEGAPNWTGEPRIQHLLLPLDGSALAEQIIEPAIELGRLLQADYTLLRVVVPTVTLLSPANGGTFGEMTESLIDLMNTTTEQHRQEAGEYLEKIAERLRGRALQVHTQVVVEPQPASAILQSAAPPVIDGIAIATHGRHGLPRFVLGSVADKIVRGTTLPVLVYRPQGG